jgi:hypothetical protein
MDEREACGNVMDGPASLCREAGNGGNQGVALKMCAPYFYPTPTHAMKIKEKK